MQTDKLRHLQHFKTFLHHVATGEGMLFDDTDFRQLEREVFKYP